MIIEGEMDKKITINHTYNMWNKTVHKQIVGNTT